MSIGFLKDVGGSKRMRFVKPGNDANDLSLPANKVIFDSNANEYLSVYASGTVTFASDNGSIQKVASWPSLGFIPFAWAGWRVMQSGALRNFIPFPVAPSDTPGTIVHVAADGLYADSGGFSDVGYPVYLDYLVFRKRAN